MPRRFRFLLHRFTKISTGYTRTKSNRPHGFGKKSHFFFKAAQGGLHRPPETVEKSKPETVAQPLIAEALIVLGRFPNSATAISDG